MPGCDVAAVKVRTPKLPPSPSSAALISHKERILLSGEGEEDGAGSGGMRARTDALRE